MNGNTDLKASKASVGHWGLPKQKELADVFPHHSTGQIYLLFDCTQLQSAKNFLYQLLLLSCIFLIISLIFYSPFVSFRALCVRHKITPIPLSPLSPPSLFCTTPSSLRSSDGSCRSLRGRLAHRLETNSRSTGVRRQETASPRPSGQSAAEDHARQS